MKVKVPTKAAKGGFSDRIGGIYGMRVRGEKLGTGNLYI